MSRFKQGQVITLKSDKSITGAIVNIMEGYPETRYQVFTAAGMQTYYESQIDIQESDEEMEKVNAERFNAGLTASLIRKGMEVTVLVAFIPFFDVREELFLIK